MKTTTIALLAATVATFAIPIFAQEPAQREMTDEEKARIAAKAADLDDDGKFQLMEAILPAGQPRVGLLNVAKEGAAEMARTYADELEAMKNDVLKKRDEAVAELNAYQNAMSDYRTVSKLRAAAARGSDAFAAESKRLAASIASNLNARDLTMESYVNLLATLASVEEIANNAGDVQESVFGLYETIADAAKTASPKSVAEQLEAGMRLSIVEYALRNASLSRAENALAAVRPFAVHDERVRESLLLLGPPLLLLQGKDAEALRMWDDFLAAQRAMTHGEDAARASDETWTEMMGHLLKDMKKNGVKLGVMAARFPEL